MEDIENLLTDEDFKTGFESEIVAEGKYKLKVIKGLPRIKVSEGGNRYLNLRLAAIETETGEEVNSKVIYHTVPFEGVNKNGDYNRGMFAGFFTAIGLDKDAVRSVYASLLAEAPAARDIGEKTEVTLKLNGDILSLDNRTLMGSVKIRTYTNKKGEAVTENRVGSVWATKAE